MGMHWVKRSPKELRDWRNRKFSAEWPHGRPGTPHYQAWLDSLPTEEAERQIRSNARRIKTAR